MDQFIWGTPPPKASKQQSAKDALADKGRTQSVAGNPAAKSAYLAAFLNGQKGDEELNLVNFKEAEFLAYLEQLKNNHSQEILNINVRYLPKDMGAIGVPVGAVLAVNSHIKTFIFSATQSAGQKVDEIMNGPSAVVINPKELLVIADSFRSASPSLTRIELVDLEDVGPEVARTLSHVLRGNQNITALSLRGSWIGSVDKRGACFGLFSALKRNYSLTELNLSNCNVTQEEISAGLGVLSDAQALRFLDITQNGCVGQSAIESRFRQNPALEEVVFSETSVSDRKTLKRSPGTRDEVARSKMHLIQKPIDLSSMSAQFWQSYQLLNTLVLFSCKLLKPIPVEILQLRNLKRFALCRVSLTQFPEVIVMMSWLEMLDISFNQISTFPPKIEGMAALRKLYANNNLLTELPYSLMNLVHLDMCFNKLTSLTFPNHKVWPQLRTLSLKDNQIEKLSPSIQFLTSLKKLWLGTNMLEYLPPELRKLTNLAELKVGGNPIIKSIPRDFLKTKESLFRYLEDSEKGSKQFSVLKLMFVGDGNVGKTSLLTALRSRHAPKDQAEKMKALQKQPNVATDGIDITDIQFTDSEETQVTYSCWDFAGQEIYYVTHQFFLSEKAFYLVIFNMAEDNYLPKVEYWCSSVVSRAGKRVPILLVGTHRDDRKCSDSYVKQIKEKLMADLLPRFGNVMGFCPLATKGNLKGMDEFEQKLWSIAKEKNLIRQSIPASYLMLINMLRNRETAAALYQAPTEEYCTLSKFSEMARRFSIEAELDSLLSFLHDRGFVLYFGKDEKSALKDWVFLSPKWLADVMKSVFTLKHTFGKRGRLLPRELPLLWKDFASSMHEVLIKLLERFEILYPLEDRETREFCYLIPSLLPAEKPDIGVLWLEKDLSKVEHSRVYNLDFVPTGLISRFILRMMQVDGARVHLYWRHGVVTELGDEMALVEMIPAEKSLRVTIRSPKPKSQGTNTANPRGMTMSLQRTMGARDVRPPSHRPDANDPNASSLSSSANNNNIRNSASSVNASTGAGSSKEKDKHRLLKLCIDVADALTTKWYYVSVEKWVWCSHCISAGDSKPHRFKHEDLELSAADGNYFITCPKKAGKIRIDQLMPEVQFAECKINFQREITKERELGAGGFGVIYLGKFRGAAVAIKELKLNANSKTKTWEELRTELRIMISLVHPNVVSLKGYCVDPYCLVLEYVPCGDLYNFLHTETNKIDWALRLRIAFDLAMGMLFLHSLTPPLIHRDLKSANVLLNSTSPHATVVAKVADFGLSSELVLPNLKDRAVMNPTWLAPEVIRGEEYSEKSDVYSYGMVLNELLDRKHPFIDFAFQTDVEIETAVQSGKRPSIATNLVEAVPQYAQLINDCWHGESNQRPHFDQILRSLLPLCTAHGLKLSLDSAPVMSSSQRFDPAALASSSPIGSSSNQQNQSIPLNSSSGALSNSNSRNQNNSPANSASRSITNSTEMIPGSASNSSMLVRKHAAAEVEGTMLRRVELELPLRCMVSGGNRVYTGTKDGAICVWNAENGGLVAKAKVHTKDVTALTFHDHRWLLSASFDKSVKIVKAEDPVSNSGQRNRQLCSTGPKKEGVLLKKGNNKMFKDSYKRRHLILNPDSALGCLLYFKDAKDSKAKGNIDLLADVELKEENNMGLFSIQLKAKANGRKYLFDAKTPKEREEWMRAMKEVIATSTATQMDAVRILDTAATVPLSMLLLPLGAGVTQPSNPAVWVGCDDGTVRIFAVPFDQMTAALMSGQPQTQATTPTQPCVKHVQSSDREQRGEVVSLVFDPSSGFVCAAAGKHILLINPNTLVIEASIFAHTNPVSMLAIGEPPANPTPGTAVTSSASLWSAGRDYSIKRWDLKTLKCVLILQRKLNVMNGPPLSLLLVNDKVWAGQKFGEIDIWSIESGTLLKTLTVDGLKEGVTGLLLVWNRTVWSAHLDGNILIWK